MICILLTQTLCFCMDQCIPLALYSPDSTMWGKYLYIFWDHQAQPKLTEFATIYQSWPNSLQINQCFQVLLDVNSKHYPILSKVKAEILAAFAEYVWWRAMVTLAVCNSCRERLHWDMCCGENTVPFCCLGSTPYRVSPSAFQLAHWDVTQDEPSYLHQGHEFHGVCHLAEWRAWTSLFSLLLERSQHRMASYRSLSLVFHHLLAWASSKLRGSVCVYHGNILHK